MSCLPFSTQSDRVGFFFFNDTAPTEIYTLSLHDALPICPRGKTRPARTHPLPAPRPCPSARACSSTEAISPDGMRSEEHTSELQSHSDLVCRLLLEKKKEGRNISNT